MDRDVIFKIGIVMVVLMTMFAGCVESGGPANNTSTANNGSVTGNTTGNANQSKAMKSSQQRMKKIWSNLDPEVRNVLNKTEKATASISSYRYSLDTRINQVMEVTRADGNLETEMQMNQSGEGAVNFDARKSMQNLTQNTTIVKMEGNSSAFGQMLPGIGNETQNVVYLVNNTVYMKPPGQSVTTANGTQNMTWMKMPGTYSRLWNKTNRINRQKSYLMLSSNVKMLPEQTVNGQKTYVLRSSPTPEEFKRHIRKHMSNVSFVNILQSNNIVIENITSTQWISKKTYLPVKTDTHMTMSMTMNMPSKQGGNSTMTLNQDMNTSMTFSDFNSDINIQLPQEARNNKTLSEMFNGSMGSYQRKGTGTLP